MVDDDGTQLGIMPTAKARALADAKQLDLVEISPTAQPPVCRIMNFGKFRYEQEKRDREAKRHQSQSKVKEVQYHANVEAHDYQTKLRHVRDFIAEGNRVKISLKFRGRENAHQELGFEVMQRILSDCGDIATPEQMPNLMGKLLTMMLGPRRGARQQPPAATKPASPPPAQG